jgi:hypothetical protein
MVDAVSLSWVVSGATADSTVVVAFDPQAAKTETLSDNDKRAANFFMILL